MIYLWSDTALLLLENRATAMHSHYALILASPADRHYGPLILSLLDGHRFRDLSSHFNSDNPDLDRTSFNTSLSCQKARQWMELLICRLHELAADSREAGAGKQNPIKRDTRIQSACEFIRRFSENSIELQELATRACLSKSRFRHLFKQETGLSIRQFIRNTRAVEAVKRILQGESITAAAHGSGFSDTAHLSRTFKAMYGLSLSSLYKGRQHQEYYLCDLPTG